MDFKSKIREIRDFPREGINYKDISTLLLDSEAYHAAINELAKQCKHKQADLIVCPKARALTIGAPLAYVLGVGLIVLGNAGRIPEDDISAWHNTQDFAGESMEINLEAIKPNSKVLVVDELLATGRTAASTIKLIEKLGGDVVGTVFLIELTGLGGRVNLTDYDTISLIQYNY
ncbi:MAG TPA: adenine phosphoribosyltransferase [Bacillota bacterium]|jgi:adenine phosphoribosyltransferase|nr:adenine phosphoribosyltransferase [Peptococcaceae bacterium MAG4]NLW37112.1 adenine phosphoribosyltransferase [Peptococcaceae bacterium]HPZ44137.1 adenine phosphoribosyltransferase [Bacillota bacterium]HQD76911.1 adenine phosphoribosyltransferase [Bacillota bacterium]HUM59383.1 adenine phosphoribosyltransferase [Bacillota bacterium]